MPIFRVLLIVLCLAPLSLFAGAKKPTRPVPERPPAPFEARTTGPVRVVFELRDGGALPDGVERLLRGFVEAISRRDIEAALSFFDPENRAEQGAIGLHDDAQFIVEGMGFSQSGRLSGPAPAGRVDYRALFDSLEQIILSHVAPMTDANGVPMRGWLEAHGEFSFDQGGRYRLLLQLNHTEAGWLISPPMG